MKFSIVLVLLVVTSFVYSFEGIVSCKKIENGVESNFKFYIKGSQIAIISEDAMDGSKFLFDKSANTLKICIDDLDPSKKGYYELSAQNAPKYKQLEVLEKFKLETKVIQGILCEGFGVKTNQGNATVYFGSKEIDIRGFSMFFNDPIYEVIDASDNDKLPVQLSVTSASGTYVIYLSAEQQSLSASIFEVPPGLKKFEVKIE